MEKYNYIYFLGTEEIGKTTLFKKIAKDYLSKDEKIILLNGIDIKTNNIDRLVQKFYEKYSLEAFKDLSDVVLLIDDFSKQNMKEDILEGFLEELCGKFKKVIIFIDKNNFIQNTAKYLKIHFNEVEILPFGHLKRHEIIKKWVTIGDDDINVISNEVYVKIDNISAHFDIIMKKNIMDSRPIYIISIMQTLENLSMTNGNYSLTSYGQCYHVLITSMLNKANISMSQDLDGVMNFLSYLGYHFYNNNIDEISEDDFQYLCLEYKKKFVPPTNIKNILLDSGILATPDNYTLRFSQKYLYYFCCAKYISDNSEKMKDVITNLCQNIHNEQTANILIFLVHHLRGTSLLEEILTHTICLLDSVQVFDMTAESNRNFKKILGEELQKIVIESKNAEEQRATLLKRKDELEAEVDSIE
ncbi:ATP-binding protein, partial [Acinetobacter baumannii]|nr:ATP-binding protein [Acinetobacter baumannii]